MSNEEISTTEESRQRILPSLGGFVLQRVGGLVMATLLVGLTFAWLSDWLMLKPANLLVMIRLMGTLGIIGLGLTVVLIVGEIDLSFAALATLSAMITGVTWVELGWPLYVGLLLSMAVAAVVGLFNAYFVTVIRVPSFIVTLGSSTLVFGFTLLVSGTKPSAPLPLPSPNGVDPGWYRVFRALSSRDVLPGNFPMQVVWMLGFGILFSVLLSRGVFGFRLKAIGGNEQAAVLAKLPVRRYKTMAFLICALMAAMAGTLDFAFISTVQPTPGTIYLFPAFTAVIIGGASLSGGRGTASGTLMGALLLAVIQNGLSLNATSPFWQQMSVGTVTIFAVVLDQWTRRRRQ